MQKKIIFIFIVLVPSMFVGCKSAPKKIDPLIQDQSKGEADQKEFYLLRLNAQTGDVVHTRYHSDSQVEDFESAQKVRDRQDVLDFMVTTKVVESNASALKVSTVTVRKDGTASLHDMAFPEVNENIDFVYSRSAQVLKAGEYDNTSIFFMPPISLPDDRVQVGDTWVMNHGWISSQDGLPLHINMVTIFKAVTGCGKYGQCADLELSGKIAILGQTEMAKARFNSRIWGRMLMALRTGEIVWSEMHSKDQFDAPEVMSKVRSCMVSKIQDNPSPLEPLTCDPNEDHVKPILFTWSAEP